MGLPKKIPRSRPAVVKAGSDTPDENKRIIVNRYRVEKKLGSGNFGTAFLVTDLKASNSEDGLKVLKEIPCGDLQPDETVDAMHEAKLLSKLKHTGIVKFHDSFLDGEFFCIVTEYCEGGDLDEYITRMKKRGQSIPEKQVMEWTCQLLLAVHYMHSRRVLHRDLKARNIFLRNNCIKIGDFGISRILMGTADMATTFTGTPYYMSPEVLKHEGYNAKSDVWSIGCIMYELCCQKHAFEGQGLMGVMYKIVEGDCPPLGTKYSKNMQELLKLIFTKDPEKRPAASEVLKMPFVGACVERMKQAVDNDEKSADSDAHALEQTLAKKYHRKDLQRAKEEDPYEHMSPRERMRLRKQEEADRKALELAEAAKEYMVENMTRKQALTTYNKQRERAPWEGGPRKEMTFVAEDMGTLVQATQFRPKTAPTIDFNEDIESDEAEDTMVPISSLNRTAPTNSTFSKQKSSHLPAPRFLDDRPITPMKDRMVYDVTHSSLDFKDGVPEDPRLADTYYSQFEFDDEGEQASSNNLLHTSSPQSSFHAQSVTKRPQAPGVSLHTNETENDLSLEDDHDDDDNEGTIIGAVGGARTVGPYGDDEAAVIENLQQLNTGEGPYSSDEEYINENTVTLKDDSVAGAYGPTARSIKINNLRGNCEKKLGKAVFKKAYDYLKKARFSNDDAVSTVDESQIMTELRRIAPDHVSDCFLIDQLLFLEIQAKLDRQT